MKNRNGYGLAVLLACIVLFGQAFANVQKKPGKGKSTHTNTSIKTSSKKRTPKKSKRSSVPTKIIKKFPVKHTLGS